MVHGFRHPIATNSCRIGLTCTPSRNRHAKGSVTAGLPLVESSRSRSRCTVVPAPHPRRDPADQSRLPVTATLPLCQSRLWDVCRGKKGQNALLSRSVSLQRLALARRSFIARIMNDQWLPKSILNFRDVGKSVGGRAGVKPGQLFRSSDLGSTSWRLLVCVDLSIDAGQTMPRRTIDANCTWNWGSPP